MKQAPYDSHGQIASGSQRSSALAMTDCALVVQWLHESDGISPMGYLLFLVLDNPAARVYIEILPLGGTMSSLFPIRFCISCAAFVVLLLVDGYVFAQTQPVVGIRRNTPTVH